MGVRRHALALSGIVSGMRTLLTIFGLLLLIAGLGVTKGKQIGMLIAFGKEAEKNGPPPETVSTMAAKADTWEEIIPAIGTVTSVKGVTVSNDAPGVVSAINFESGANVVAGQVLVVLDTSVERAQLASAQARRELATINEGRTRSLVGTDSLPKSQLDNDQALLKSSGADLDALQAQISRKVVRAPFAGRLGIRNVNLGQYLNPGTAITVLADLDSVYVDFTLPQPRLADVGVGSKVRVTIEGGKDPIVLGTVAAIDPSLDQVTRSIKLRAAIPNKDDALRPGMFGMVEVILAATKSVVEIPATALVHASYGDSVFIVEAKTGDSSPVRQQFVKVNERRGDFVGIQDGLKPGEEVVVAGAFKLHNGSKVVVNNDAVKVTPSLDPHPANH